MKIGFATNDWSRSLKYDDGTPCLGGSGHIRVGQYILPLRKSGYDAIVGILAYNKYTKRFGIHDFYGNDHFDCDVVVIQRYMHKGVLGDIRSATAAGQIVINDVDDWYWGLSDRNAAKSLTDPKNNPNENIDHYKNILMASSGIITSTPFLTEKISKWNETVIMHHNYVDMGLFKRRKHMASKMPVVGWMGSTAHRSGDLQILRGFAQRLSGKVSWHHTGHVESPHFPKFWDEIKVHAGNVTRTNFLKPKDLNEGIQFDIGIVPLSDIPFNSAKSWIKGIEYAAAGVPFVASSLDEYVRLNKEYNIGILAKRPRDFITHIESLCDVDYRREEADKNYENVQSLDVYEGVKSLIRCIEGICNEAR
jgi:hypothetical protein